MKYSNISKNGSIILEIDKKYSKKELLTKFEEFIYSSNFILKQNINIKTLPYEIIIKNETQEFKLFFILKNITGAGWENKPKIKRIQVKNTEQFNHNCELNTTNNQQIFVLFGYYNFEENPLLVAWNPYNYNHHKTIRSCYVSIDLLHECYDKGYICTVDSGNRIWLFDPFHFKKFLIDYIEYQSEQYHEKRF